MVSLLSKSGNCGLPHHPLRLSDVETSPDDDLGSDTAALRKDQASNRADMIGPHRLVGKARGLGQVESESQFGLVTAMGDARHTRAGPDGSLAVPL